MYYDDPEYAARRLNGTLVRHINGNPFFVSEVFREGDTLMCRGEDYVKGTPESYDLREIDLTPVPLGYVNITGGKAVYVSRKPMRRDWRQGLSPVSLVVHGDGGKFSNFKLLMQPILKQYPSFAKCLEGIGKRNTFAFSRDFALANREGVTRIMYHQYEVGTVQEGGRVVLDPSKFFLEQHLAESMR